MDRMVKTGLNKTGIYSALFTPADSSGNLDVPVLRDLIRYEMKHGIEGVYCCGSSGEALLLSTDERKKLVEVVAEETSGNIPFIVHTGALSTRDAIELSTHAQTCGAAAVSLIPPIYYNYSPEEIAGYYGDVVKAVDLGVIVYNIPQFTGISFSKENKLLCDEKIIGIKHTSMNLYELERIKQAFGNKTIFNGFDEIWLYSMTAGATATIGTTVNICPPVFKAIRESALAGDMDKAKQIQSMLNGFIETLVKVNVFPAAKYCMALLGVDIGPCRKPFSLLTGDEKTIIKDALDLISDYL